MGLMPKLEKAVERGTVLIDETIELVRLTQELVRRTTPLVGALPALVTSARAALEPGPADGR